MTISLQPRARAPRRLGQVLPVALPLLLGIMVLLWGTGYKVSLYNVKSEAKASAPAKICTRPSDVAKSGLDRVTAEQGVLQAQVLFALLSFADSEFRIIRPVSPRSDLVLTPPAFRSTPSLDRRPPTAEPRLLLA